MRELPALPICGAETPGIYCQNCTALARTLLEHDLENLPAYEDQHDEIEEKEHE